MEIGQQIAAIVFVIGLLVLIAIYLKNKGMAAFTLPTGTRKPRRLEVIERLAVSPAQSLLIVRVDRTTLLIGASASGCQLLRTLEGDSQ
jgi:flagellar biogenesis protein FliO